MIKAILRTGTVLALGTGFATGALALPPDFYDKLDADSRPMEDKMRDDARRPGQVMELLQVEEGMTIVDVSAGGGWYTRVQSAAVGPEGKVIAHFGPRALQRNDGAAQKALAEELGNVEAFFGNLEDLEPNSVDRVLTALSIHHQTGERGIAFLQGMYDALKPGGLAAIIDHEGSPGTNAESLHRIDPDDVRELIDEVGFEIVEESDLLHTNADDHTLSVDDPALARNTDRFLFIVRKP